MLQKTENSEMMAHKKSDMHRTNDAKFFEKIFSFNTDGPKRIMKLLNMAEEGKIVTI